MENNWNNEEGNSIEEIIGSYEIVKPYGVPLGVDKVKRKNCKQTIHTQFRVINEGLNRIMLLLFVKTECNSDYIVWDTSYELKFDYCPKCSLPIKAE